MALAQEPGPQSRPQAKGESQIHPSTVAAATKRRVTQEPTMAAAAEEPAEEQLVHAQRPPKLATQPTAKPVAERHSEPSKRSMVATEKRPIRTVMDSIQVEKNVARPLNSSEQFFSTMEKHTNSGTGRFLELAADTKTLIDKWTTLPVAESLAAQLEAAAAVHAEHFSDWVFDLRCGANVLVQGVGSKRQLLQDFAQYAHCELIAGDNEDLVCLEMKGYLPDSQGMVRSAAAQVATHLGATVVDDSFLLEMRMEILRVLAEPTRQSKRVLLLVHSIDMMDCQSRQELLKVLGQMDQVHFVASTDHLNADSIFDSLTEVAFDWRRYRTDTHLPYTAEVDATTIKLLATVFETKQVCNTASVESVLRALTQHSRQVFQVLLVAQYAHADQQGLRYDQFYERCVDKFLVTSKQIFNQHLHELEEHHIVQRKHANGAEILFIDMDKASLKVVHQQLIEADNEHKN